ncbi:MAG: hypothetical protein ABIQ93_02740 [Saprospiraceae bacterium]
MFRSEMTPLLRRDVTSPLRFQLIKPTSMKSPIDPLAHFYPEAHYHVYNRTNHREPLFFTDENRRFFLSKYQQYLGDYVDTFAWSLLENHFHFSIRIKSAKSITAVIQQIPELDRIAAQQHFLATPEPERNFHTVVERQFTRLFTSYAMAFNQQYARSGNLFYRPFKRVAIQDDDHLVWLIYYIHANIAKHGVMSDFRQYPWSSYAAFLSDKPTHLYKTEVLNWFGGLAGFLAFHQPDKDFPEELDFLQPED